MCFILPNDLHIANEGWFSLQDLRTNFMVSFDCLKILSIFHHVVNKVAQGDKADFEINYVILRRNQIRVCTPLTSKKYRLYIGVD